MRPLGVLHGVHWNGNWTKGNGNSIRTGEEAGRWAGGRKGFSTASLKDTIELAVETLASALGQEFKTEEIEVGVVSAEHPNFRLLNAQDVDAVLNAIAEKD